MQLETAQNKLMWVWWVRQSGLRGLLAQSNAFTTVFGAEAGVDAETAIARRVREVALQLGERVRTEMRILPMPTCALARFRVAERNFWRWDRTCMPSCARCSCPCAPLDTGPVVGPRACAELAERMHAEVCLVPKRMSHVARFGSVRVREKPSMVMACFSS